MATQPTPAKTFRITLSAALARRFLPVLAVVAAGSATLLRGAGADKVAQARQILREDGFWDIASTTGFFQHRGPQVRIPFDRLQARGLRGGMLGIGTLTDVYMVKSSRGWSFKEVPPGTTIFKYVFQGPELIQRMLWEFDATHLAAAEDAHLKVALTAADLEEARRGRRTAVVLGLDTGAEIDEDLPTLRMYHRLGLRKLALVHGAGTDWADSVHSKRLGEGGLSEFGRKVVLECNRLGIMVDLSHGSDKTFWDALAVSTRPLIATHSGARAVANMSRNLTDDMLRALAAKGGIVGVCGLFDEVEEHKMEAGSNVEDYFATGLYLASKYQDRYRFADALSDQAERAEAARQLGLDKSREYAYPGEHIDLPEKRAVVVRTLLRHFDHIVKIVGIDHVGIGTDLNMCKEGYPELAEEIVVGLVERGYGRDQIRKILFGNYLNYFRAVAARTPSDPNS